MIVAAVSSCSHDSCQGQRTERPGRQDQALHDDFEPLRATKYWLLWIAWRTHHDTALAFAHGESKRGKDIRHEIEKEDLERQKWQRQRGDDRQAYDKDLGKVTGKQVSDEAPDVAEDDPSFADGKHDGRKGVI